MKSSAQASKEYLKGAVMTASPEQLQLMLLDGAIRFTLQGQEALQRADIEGAFNAFDRAQRIVLELTNGLRREINPELVDQLAALYDFVYRRLIDANIHREPKAADDALRILRHQRETWALLMEKLAQSAAPTGSSPGGSAGTSESGEPGGLGVSLEG
jgi:flagellar protein FliS